MIGAFFRSIGTAFAGLVDRLFPRVQVSPPREETKTYVRAVPRYDGAGDPPPMHWSPCHPSTRNRFKAKMTCPEGHGLTLRGHTISADGGAHPSVICPNAECSFHEFVRLDGWTFGEVPAEYEAPRPTAAA